MESSAVFSKDRIYRYELWRKYDNNLPFCMFIALNPSTATETEDDPTVRRCIQYSKDWRYGGLCMTNIFAFRATNPKDMMKFNEPIGPENNETLKRLSEKAGIIVAAWGKEGTFMNRGQEIIDLIPNLYCLKKNKDGSPSHPLYLKKDLLPFKYN